MNLVKKLEFTDSLPQSPIAKSSGASTSRRSMTFIKATSSFTQISLPSTPIRRQKHESSQQVLSIFKTSSERLSPNFSGFFQEASTPNHSRFYQRNAAMTSRTKEPEHSASRLKQSFEKDSKFLKISSPLLATDSLKQNPECSLPKILFYDTNTNSPLAFRRASSKKLSDKFYSNEYSELNSPLSFGKILSIDSQGSKTTRADSFSRTHRSRTTDKKETEEKTSFVIKKSTNRTRFAKGRHSTYIGNQLDVIEAYRLKMNENFDEKFCRSPLTERNGKPQGLENERVYELENEAISKTSLTRFGAEDVKALQNSLYGENFAQKRGLRIRSISKLNLDSIPKLNAEVKPLPTEVSQDSPQNRPSDRNLRVRLDTAGLKSDGETSLRTLTKHSSFVKKKVIIESEELDKIAGEIRPVPVPTNLFGFDEAKFSGLLKTRLPGGMNKETETPFKRVRQRLLKVLKDMKRLKLNPKEVKLRI